MKRGSNRSLNIRKVKSIRGRYSKKDVKKTNKDQEGETPEERDKRLAKEEALKIEYQKKLAKSQQERLEEEKKFTAILVRESPEEKIVCLEVDGFDTSEGAFEIVSIEFLPKLNSTLICPYIFNSRKDQDYNWRHQKEFVIENYRTKLRTNYGKQAVGKLITQDTDRESKHPIEQAFKIALKNKAEYFFFGYNGLKTGNCKSENIEKGLDYLLRESNMPVVIFKDANLRGINNMGYKWLILLDRASQDSLKVVDYFIPLIDKEKDSVFGLGLLSKYNSKDDIEEPFYQRMKELGLDEDQVVYESFKYQDQPTKLKYVKDFVNQNEEHYFDFVMFYTNPDKYKVETEKSESIKYIESISSNICFVNGIYIERMKIKEEEERTKQLEKELKEKEEQKLKK